MPVAVRTYVRDRGGLGTHSLKTRDRAPGLVARGGRRRELGALPLEDALQLVHLYAERGSPKYERAALRWLERYLSEAGPSLEQVARVVASLAERART